MAVVNQPIADLLILRDDDNAALTGLTAGSFDTLEAFAISAPATTAAVTITEIGGGEYEARFTPTAAGTWALHYVYGASSLFDFREEVRRYEVTATAATPTVFAGDPYLSVDDLKARLGITTSDDDARLAANILAAGQQVDAWTGRTFTRTATATARVLNPHAYDVLSLPDAVSVAEIAGDIALNRTYSDVWETDDYDLYPFEAAELGQPYTEVRTVWRTRRVFILLARSVRITAVWGWPAVPPAIVEATAIQAARLFHRGFSPLGLSGSQEFGLTAIPRIDPDVQALVNPFRVMAF